MNRFFYIRLLSLIFLLCIAYSSFAIMIGLSTEDLTKASEIVTLGEVEDVESMWSNDGKTIITRAPVLVNNVIRGSTFQKKIIVEYDGGEIDGIGLKVSDTATLKKGERVLLFLKSGESKVRGVVRRVVSKAQGVYKIGDDGIVRKRGFSIAGDQNIIDNNIPLEELIEKIESVR